MSKRNTIENRLEPRQQLELFVRRVNELNQRSIIQQGNFQKLQLRTRIDQSGWSHKLSDVDGKPVDEEAFRSLLLALRPFILENESIFLTKVFDICGRYLADNAPREGFNKAKQWWKSDFQRNRDIIQIFDDDELLTPQMILDVWINGHYFHNDPKHLERFERWKDHRDFLDGQFKMIIQELVHLIRWLGGFVHQAFENGWIDFSRSH